MKILAVDYGDKRLGLAFADTTLGVVLPFGLIAENKLKEKVVKLIKMLKSEKADQLVIGYPLSANGHENKNTEKVKKFMFEVQKNTSVPVELFDERFSSQAADKRGGTVSRDEISAMVILEGYILSKQSNI